MRASPGFWTCSSAPTAPTEQLARVPTRVVNTGDPSVGRQECLDEHVGDCRVCHAWSPAQVPTCRASETDLTPPFALECPRAACRSTTCVPTRSRCSVSWP